MTHLARIAEKVFNRPLLLHPQKAEVILWVLSERVGVTVDKPTPEENRFVGSPKYVNRQKLYGVQDGAAIITIEGSLVNRGEWIGAASGLVSYEGIEAQVSAALADANVSSIVLDIDSPGGEATGMYALAAKIRSARQIKPVVALVNDLAASAAYGIASQADQILVSPTSVVGSVGVVLLHLDVSKQMEMKGQVPTLIYAGAHKVDGNPFAPLPDTVKADLQRDVMTFYDRFVETVAAGRGDRISESAIRATEARTFIGQEAIDIGLADRMGGVAEATSLGATLAAAKRLSTGTDHAGRPGGASAAAVPATAATKMENTMDWKDISADTLRQNRPDLVAAIESTHDISAKLTTAKAEGVSEGKATLSAAVAAERDRVLGIQAAAFAGQEELAAKLVAEGKSVGEAAVALNADFKSKGAHLEAIAGMDGKVNVAAAPTGAGATSPAEKPEAEMTDDELKMKYAGSDDLKAEFGSDGAYIGFIRGSASGRVRILKSKAA